MASNEKNITGASISGVLAVVFSSMAMLVQFVFFPMGTVHLNGTALETYPNLLLASLGFLLAGTIFGLIGLRHWNKTLPLIAFVVQFISIIAWVVMFYIGAE